MSQLVILRHGESEWNQENKFTGWTDVDLSFKGIIEAKEAGRILRELGFSFDIAFTSVLQKAIRTLWIVLDEMDLMWIPVRKSWRLNERHYGALQGQNKLETNKKYGEDQVHQWRRSWNVRPPRLLKTDDRYPGNNPRYRSLSKQEIPVSESLQDTFRRLIPYWEKIIVPEIKLGKKVLIVAHGNSLRALIKHLDKLSSKAIAKVNLPTGIPLVYNLDQRLSGLKHYYLGDPKKVENAIVTVANQDKVLSDK